jgi:hypothetical protein
LKEVWYEKGGLKIGKEKKRKRKREWCKKRSGVGKKWCRRKVGKNSKVRNKVLFF